ncbi:MAG: DUF488 domain-containing protein [Actinomycetota bacterium]|nr:DUF488 domain-containing protein [Actinomycetota bacterium]
MGLLSVGHGTASAGALRALLRDAGIARVVDVRSAPGSRRNPQFGRSELERWLPEAGLAYRWEPKLGGWRKPRPDSPNVALRNGSFRGYADHMSSAEFRSALELLLAEAARESVAAMCSERLWWRCHRRLLADAAVLLHDVDVRHLLHDGRQEAHRLTEGARRDDGGLVYDGGPSGRPVG